MRMRCYVSMHILALFAILCVSNAACAEDTSPGHGVAEISHESDDGHGGGHAVHDLGHGDQGASLDSVIEIRSDMAIYTFVVFLLLLGILGKFAWPAITVALEEREKRIEGNIAAAAAKHEEAKQLLAQHEAKLAEASSEVRELLEEARRSAERTKAQIVEEAKKSAEAERDRAIREVDLAADAAMKQLAETSANLAVDLAGKVVRTNITADQQSQLVRDALAKLAEASPSNN